MVGAIELQRKKKRVIKSEKRETGEEGEKRFGVIAFIVLSR
jgi:hypothetical protein